MENRGIFSEDNGGKLLDRNVFPYTPKAYSAIPILRARVIQTKHSMDMCVLYTDFPTPLPHIETGMLTLKFNAEMGCGAAYIRKHFGLELEIIS